jgi:putative ABC transport system permease protein
MFTKHLKIAWRILLRKRAFSLINIFGLAIGIASCFFILLYVQDELNYEKIHKKADEIYAVGLDMKIGNEEFKGHASPLPLAFTLTENYSQFKEACRLIFRDEQLVKYKNRVFTEDNVCYADSTFLNMFSFDLIQGDKENALNKPNSILLTEKMAKKYFGKEDPMGKILNVNSDKEYIVTGICKNIPKSTHLEFDFLIPLRNIIANRYSEWGSNSFNTYVTIDKKANFAELDTIMYKLLDKNFGPITKQIMNLDYKEFIEAGNRYTYFFEPLLDTHLKSQMTGGFENGSSMVTVWVLSLIALFILLIACVNFVNLSTAKSALRAKEVGVRKTLGSSRKQLIIQFLTESFLISTIATIISIGIVEFFIDNFNELVNKSVSMEYFSNPIIIPSIILLTLFTGILAGTYSAFFQSSFKILTVLKGEHRTAMKSGRLRNLLVLLQFSVSIFLIICTLVVFHQIKYFQNKEIGFDKHGLLLIKRAYALPNQAQTFKKELLKHSGVEAISLTRGVPLKGFNGNGIIKEGANSKEAHVLQRFVGDYDLIKTFGIEVIKGREFNPDLASDSSAFILNEKAIPSLNLVDPLSERLLDPSQIEEQNYRPIIGIVKNFNYMPFSMEILPLAIEIMPSTRKPIYVCVRVKPNMMKQVLKEAQNMWLENTTDQPFEYMMMDEEFNSTFDNERRLGKIYTIFAILAVVIACLGLFALAAFAAEQRSKEIGVRKAMGAEIGSLIWLLAREFTKWVGIANIIAWPVAYWLMQKWLNNFAYSIDLYWWFFVLAAVLAFSVALITVMYQAFKAATVNPVTSLRYE